jgi:hypothetical protein
MWPSFFLSRSGIACISLRRNKTFCYKVNSERPRIRVAHRSRTKVTLQQITIAVYAAISYFGICVSPKNIVNRHFKQQKYKNSFELVLSKDRRRLILTNV